MIADDFWAKTQTTSDAEVVDAHSVLDHMTDAALAAELLLDRVWPYLSARLCRSWGTTISPCRLVSLVAGLHDIGKVSRGFQIKVPELTRGLADAGLSLTFKAGMTRADRDHGLQTYAFLYRKLLSCWGAAHRQDALAVAQASAAHHGRYYPADALQQGLQDGDEWDTAREMHFRLLLERFGFTDGTFPPPETRLEPSWTVTTAGLISVADWIASSLEVPFRKDDSETYIAERLAQIERRLSATGLLARPNPARRVSFEHLFTPPGAGTRWRPNRTQVLMREMAMQACGPFLLLSESPTGVGKTEGSLWTHAAVAERSGTGLYFALPTMATTNGMFPRVRRYLERLYSGEKTQLQLVQSQARLNPDFAELIQVATNGPDHVGGHGVRAYDWFNGRKRALLAQHAVGTVDQLMLAAMHTRHHFVRLTGLAEKLVVIDEIHAYDVYMESIIASLLRWLRAVGSSVILLSATLSRAQKLRLVESYSQSGSARAEHAGPAVTVADEAGVRSAVVDDLPARTLRMRVREMHDNSVGAFHDVVTKEVLSAVRIGGVVACVVNTVADAQEIHRQLAMLIDKATELWLLHGRFTRGDRQRRESELVRRLGPSAEDRPTRAIVIATQIVEQSLDVDFDTMITDLAPVDLLIQRAGRVHRHTSAFPPSSRAHTTRTVTVISPPLAEFRPRAAVAAVYEPLVLGRTRSALDSHGELITIPADDALLVEAVYGTEPIEPPASMGEPVELEVAALGKQLAEQRQGEWAALNAPDPPLQANLWGLAQPMLDPDEIDVRTRLGRESIEAVLLQPGASAAPEDLVDAAVRVSDPRVVAALKETEPPKSWQKHWFLARCRPLDLRDGPVDLGTMRVSYSRERGLEFAHHKEDRL